MVLLFLLSLLLLFPVTSSSSFGDDLRARYTQAISIPHRDTFLQSVKDALLVCAEKGHCECWVNLLVPRKDLPIVLVDHKYLVHVPQIQQTFQEWAVGHEERILAMRSAFRSLFQTLIHEAPFLQVREHELLNYLFVVQGWCSL